MLRIFKRKWLLLLLVVLAVVVINRVRSRGPTIQPGSFLLVDFESRLRFPTCKLIDRL